MLKSEDFYADPVNALEQTSKFLNLPELDTHEKQRKYRLHNYNTTPYPKMNPDTRKRLIEYFEPHNERLYDLLGVNLDWNR